jgi:hypothetical protein
MSTRNDLNELRKYSEMAIFIQKLTEYEKAKKQLVLQGLDISKTSEAISCKDKIRLLNLGTEVHNMLTELISILIKMLTPEEACSVLGIKLSEYYEIDFNLKLPIVRTGRFLKNDLITYEKIQASCFDLYANQLTKNRLGSKLKRDEEL